MRLPLMFGVMGILSLVTLTQAQTQDKKPPKKLPPFIMEMLKQGPDEFLKQFDKNKDGLLQKDELPPFLQKAFDKVDRNTDGALNREEVTQLLQIAQQFVPGQFPGKGGGVEAIIDGLLKQFDTDTDGKISKAEAKGRIADGFDKLDQNRDGGLDRKELRVIAQSMADAKGGIDWEVHVIDGTNVRAHRCAAGAKGGSIGKPWAALVAGSAASCTCAATERAGQWRSC